MVQDDQREQGADDNDPRVLTRRTSQDDFDFDYGPDDDDDGESDEEGDQGVVDKEKTDQEEDNQQEIKQTPTDKHNSHLDLLGSNLPTNTEMNVLPPEVLAAIVEADRNNAAREKDEESKR